MKADNQKKDNIISEQNDEKDMLNIELREVNDNLKRVEDLLSAEQVVHNIYNHLHFISVITTLIF